jgi:hypothetical protein
MSSEESIDRERIVNDKDDIVNKFICPICFFLLWKARSCASCRNLFCRNCIHTWLSENSNTCPLCRALYEEKLPSPSIQSILSQFSIQCRNLSFGCREILPYDFLEEHEITHCQFLSEKCPICEQFVLVTDLDQHTNLCKPVVVQYSPCQRSVQTELFGDELFLSPNFPTQTILSITSTVDFVGIDRFQQSRQKNCLMRLYAMIQLILSNLPMMHLILFNVFVWGCGDLIHRLTISCLYFQSFIFIILCFLLQSVNDMCIISFTIFSVIIWSSMNPKIQLNQFQMNFNLSEILLFLILIFLLFEIPLLIIRFYFAYIPFHIGTLFFAFVIFCYSTRS